MDWIDLRSDTVTLPTPEMRQAMAEAEVGDDVYGEDPTVNQLESLASSMMGKESGLFVPSGTMGNLAAILAHCGRGDEIILGDRSHTFLFEAGGVAALGGVHPRQVSNQPDGSLDLEEVRGAIRSDDVHFPVSRLVVLENTHNRCGGVSLSVDYTRAMADLAHQHDMLLHLDGARIFNAATAQGVAAADLSEHVDSVTFCLSKGLCAPVGSVLCGASDFIEQARRIRKQLGGGMRQAGILAAAGVVALNTMVDRLYEDHQRAVNLAQGLSDLPGLELNPGIPDTNMVFPSLHEDISISAYQVERSLLEYGVKVSAISEKRFRLVTHFWINDAGVQQAIKAFSKVVEDSMI
jgi:threonine aldolase